MTRAIIFDKDGTVVDSLGTQFEFFKYVCNKYKKKFVLNDGKSKIRLEKASDLRGVFRDPYEIMYNMLGFDWESDKEFLKREYLTYMTKNIPPLVQGMDSLLKRIKQRDVPIAMVTSAEATITEIRLRANNIYDLFKVIVSEDFRNGVKIRKKPAPDMLEICARELGIETRDATYVGDQPADIIASKAAGMRCVAVTWGFSTYPILEAERPDYLARNIPMLEAGLDL